MEKTTSMLEIVAEYCFVLNYMDLVVRFNYLYVSCQWSLLINQELRMS